MKKPTAACGSTCPALATSAARIGTASSSITLPPSTANSGASAGQVDPQAAVGFFMIGAVHVALMILVLKVTATMVAGWTVFGLAIPERDRLRGEAGAPAMPATVAAQVAQAQDVGQAIAAARRIDISAQPVGMPANDAAGAASGVSAQRNTIVHTSASGGAQVQPLTGAPSRTLGVGNRFRPVAKAAGVRSTEKPR
jgi:type IV secretion system protein VirB6